MNTKVSLRKSLASLTLVFFLGILIPPAQAAIPKLLTYQGILKDSAGNFLTGTYSMTFRVYDVQTGGTALWTETQSSVSVSSGRFSVQLGSVTTLSLSFNADYWLSIQVGIDSEMSPRVKLTSVGYAYRADVADSVVNGFTQAQHDTLSHRNIEGVKANAKNIAKTNFKLDSYTKAAANNMGDLVVDTFSDATGIDSAQSTNHKHRGSPDYDVLVRTGSGIDANAKLVLHMNDTNGSTTFTDSSDSAHTVTANGNAKIDTAQSKFGGASALFNGSTDYLSIPSSTDFDFGTGDFTIDFWVRFNDTAGDQVMVSRGSQFDWTIGKQVNQTAIVWIEETIPIETAWGPTAGTWYHVAVVRSGTNLKFFSNGTQVGATAVSSHNITGTSEVNVGRRTSALQYCNCWIDELRISKGIARWISNFTPPGEEYDRPGTGGPATVVSTAFTESTAPKEAMVVAEETPGTGTLTYHVSRNNGTNWTQCTKDTICNIDSQPSGTQLRWKAVITGNAELEGIAVAL